MKITVLGANGKTGREIVRQALAAGHVVNGVIRRGNVPIQKNLNIFVGDATNTEVIMKATQDSDVVISALGSNSNNTTLMTDAVKAIIAASESTGVNRVILMSSFMAQSERLKPGASFAAKLMKGLLADKHKSEALLKASSLNWTIVYATRLTSKSSGAKVRVLVEGEKIGIEHTIARADVATWILREAKDSTHAKSSVTISQ